MNGNLVGARAVTTTLPLLAAITMDTERRIMTHVSHKE